MELNAANQDNLWEIVVAVESNLQHLGLFLAVCDQDLLRTAAIENYERELTEQGIVCYRVSLDRDDPSLYRAVREGFDQIENQDQPVMFSVEGGVGLSETAETAEKSPLAKFLGYLQWTREAMREFEFPIVIWVNGEVYNEIARQAPDFYSWRQGVFFFERQQISEARNNVGGAVVTGVYQGSSEDREEDLDLSLEELLKLAAQREANNQYDANLAKLYELIAKQYGKSPKTDSEAIATWKKAIALHRKLGLKNREGWNLISLGVLLGKRSNFREAKEFLTQSLDIAKEIKDKKIEAASLGNLGSAYSHLGEYQRAIAFHQQSLEISKEIGDRQGEANSLGSLGNAYQSLGEYQQAIAFQQQSLDIEKEIGNRRGEAASLGSLGNAYQSLGEYQQAIAFQQQSLDIEKEIGNRRGEAASLGSLGIAYDSLGEYQRAISFYEQALSTGKSIGDKNGVARNTYNIALTWATLGQKWEAQQNIMAAKDLYEEMGVKYMVERCEDALRSILQIVDTDVVTPLWNPDTPALQGKSPVQPSFSTSPEELTTEFKPLPAAFQISAQKQRRPWWQRLALKFKRFIHKLFGW